MITYKTTLQKCENILSNFSQGLGAKVAKETYRLSFKGLRKFKEVLVPAYDQREMATDKLRDEIRKKYPNFNGPDLPPEFQSRLEEINSDFSAALKEEVEIEIGRDQLEAITAVLDAAIDRTVEDKKGEKVNGNALLVLDEIVEEIEECIEEARKAKKKK